MFKQSKEHEHLEERDELLKFMILHAGIDFS